ncbi:MAG: hypothetical protein A2X25_05045 [Chloroflexi bacterium GWB2_49_20]|nr:MAG: hypothetical protein A2X25_05045 [Chloroflexi bacterium GWB2_49_20]OGN80549.1 MAG: hypothetical protein A2X26_12155 [Chloroflexi bacterium GWC2_49_37]OGN83384.1 MAG: hypothetical protein A2X27_12330 [Chloroflexi bacterium GWD2_49_16]HCC78123.1 hypothetical protein [Anaerolineae bacterium]
MGKPLKLLLIFIFIISTFFLPTRTFADMAPPIQPPITNPEPGTETTYVRMMAETVLIDVQSDTKKDSLGMARITASFTMRNLGTSPENLAARFPISANDGRGQYPEISDLSVRVNSTQIPYRRVNYPDIRWQDKDVPWAEFDVTFPVGINVNVEIAYILNGSGYAPFTAFYYILETGAGWNGTIGSADIVLRLPFPASNQNVITNLQIGWSETTPGGLFSGNEVRWHYDDFEPGPEGPVQNMEFSLVSPAAWQAILDGRNSVNKNPNDSEAWGRLAMATKRVFFQGKGYRTDPGGEELYALSIAAYEKCLALKPQDAQWHAGFADLLANRAYWDTWEKGPTQDAIRGIQEIHTALQLAPTDPVVLNIAETISYLFPGGMVQTDSVYAFPWLTQTPTPFPATATIAAAFDPASVSGEYKSELLSLENQKKMQMVVRLQSDHSVVFEGRYEDGMTLLASGYWVDNGDGSIRIFVKDSDNRSYTINFRYENSGLTAIEYPSIFSGTSWELIRTLVETPTPVPSKTPTRIPESPETPTQPFMVPTKETTSPTNPICGSALLVPFGLLFAIAFSSKTHKREENIYDRKR